MAEDSQRIRDILEQLHRELDGAADIDPQVADRVASVVVEIRNALDQDDHPAVGHPSMTERLTEAAVQFEESHPTLSATVTRLIDILAQMGI
ncbi:MAG: DUF4404 family protein [Pirellulales bacterium]